MASRFMASGRRWAQARMWCGIKVVLPTREPLPREFTAAGKCTWTGMFPICTCKNCGSCWCNQSASAVRPGSAGVIIDVGSRLEEHSIHP
ncbi:unnamed protein product [Urochloa humidicola]